MESKEFLSIRLNMGKTQKEMAELLGTSLRSIQSFEQGWRKIPNEIERQVLYVLVMRSTKEQSLRPCWELESCPQDKKEHCPAWEMDSGHLCWFINGTICKGRAYSDWSEKMEFCQECQVFQPIKQIYNRAIKREQDGLRKDTVLFFGGDEILEGKSEKWRSFDLFDQVPTNIAIIDRKYRIVDVNKGFKDTFGDWNGKKCFEVYKKRKRRCRHCVATETFVDGKTRVSQERGRDLKGNLNYYLVHTSPYRDFDGNISHIIEMSTDITEKVQIQNEYRTIFDNVPCYITVINRDFQVVKSNKYFQKIFGKTPGRFCFESYKKRNEVCESCPAKMVFENGRVYNSLQEGYDRKGNKVIYMVTAAPYSKENKHVKYVIEMALDVTKTFLLERHLKEAREFHQIMIQSTLTGIIADNKDGIINIYNPSAKRMLNYPINKVIGKMSGEQIYPKNFLSAIEEGDDTVSFREGEMTDYKGNKVPIAFSGVRLKKDNDYIGKVMFFQDISKIKQLESEIIEAERLAAVGQTVAGLAHGIKNVLMGLEGGMYVVNSGMNRNNNELVKQGWDMLQNNIEKISSFVKEFLNFARGTTLNAELIDPYSIAADIIDLYKDTIAQSRIRFITKLEEGIDKAAMDAKAIHTCIANLISNAIDACLVSDNKNPTIEFSLFEKDGTICYEVKDNGSGMDYEVKKKVFTSFFTTKGSDKGTGLGLLTTKKIVHEHGGKIFFESELGKGSVFRLEFPRNRLPVPQGTSVN
ncbi:MAG: PAS domain-containing protein [Thermodesulfobacteriota bacterium]